MPAAVKCSAPWMISSLRQGEVTRDHDRLMFGMDRDHDQFGIDGDRRG